MKVLKVENSSKIIGFEERRAVLAQKIESTFVCTLSNTGAIMSKKELLDKRIVEDLRFELQNVTAEEVKKVRVNNDAYIILKDGDNYYYTLIPKNFKFNVELSGFQHKCAYCTRLSAATDENGGCEKVRRRFSKIENLPFITLGYEAKSLKTDAFIVIECENFNNY